MIESFNYFPFRRGSGESSAGEPIDPKTIRLPKDAHMWSGYCAYIAREAFWGHQELGNRYGIDWFAVSDLVFPSAGKERKRAVFLSPHSDDLQFAAAATIRSLVQKGWDVSELQFTDGSMIRNDRGFTDPASFINVRLGEGIQGARAVGIHRLGIMTTPGTDASFPRWMPKKSKRGFPETRWNGSDPALHAVWESLMRQINPHVLFSPYPDADVDGHPDHVAVAQAASRMVHWGTETDLFVQNGKGNADALEAWYRYATWAGSKTLPVNARFEFAQDDGMREMKRRSWEPFVSQYGRGYAQAADAYNTYQGAMPNVGNDAVCQAEVFNVWRPAEVTRITYVPDPS